LRECSVIEASSFISCSHTHHRLPDRRTRQLLATGILAGALLVGQTSSAASGAGRGHSTPQRPGRTQANVGPASASAATLSRPSSALQVSAANGGEQAHAGQRPGLASTLRQAGPALASWRSRLEAATDRGRKQIGPHLAALKSRLTEATASGSERRRPQLAQLNRRLRTTWGKGRGYAVGAGRWTGLFLHDALLTPEGRRGFAHSIRDYVHENTSTTGRKLALAAGLGGLYAFGAYAEHAWHIHAHLLWIAPAFAIAHADARPNLRLWARKVRQLNEGPSETWWKRARTQEDAERRHRLAGEAFGPYGLTLGSSSAGVALPILVPWEPAQPAANIATGLDLPLLAFSATRRHLGELGRDLAACVKRPQFRQAFLASILAAGASGLAHAGDGKLAANDGQPRTPPVLLLQQGLGRLGDRDYDPRAWVHSDAPKPKDPPY
jgi:hypothetical protein